MKNNRQPLKAIGLMSGTSLDGIDAAIITTDGEKILEYGKFISVPYKDKFRNRLRAAIKEAAELGKIAELSDKILEDDIAKLHAEAVDKLGEKADIIGFHGQTILHKPNKGFTWQIGNGKLLAELTGIDTVYDFRSEDVRAGGQGAPLVPVFHRAIAADLKKPAALVNIGGVGNVTFIDKNNEIWAFDTGPGNALINDLMKQHYGKEYDQDGKVAMIGTIDEEILASYLSHEYFKTKPPKSLDRNTFSLKPVEKLKPEDAIATLTAFTARSILKGLDHFEPVNSFYMCGGGAHNKAIMKQLGPKARTLSSLSLDGDAIEAQAFAFLAVRVINGLPISFPNTTGCKSSPLHNIARIHNVGSHAA